MNGTLHQCWVWTLFLCMSLFASDSMDRAWQAWSQRGEGYQDGVVDASHIQDAIDAFETELKQNPDNMRACTGLMEALYFQGDFVAKDRDTKKKIYDRGLQISTLALQHLTAGQDFESMKPEDLVAAIQSDPQAVAVCFWSSAMWGLWGDNYGAFQAARKGVAGKIRNYAEAAILLDPDAFDGGGYRMLGRLHTLAPKVVFFTGWIDRDLAIDYLEKAVATSKNEPLNILYLADALLRFQDSRKAEAQGLLKEVMARPVNPGKRVEDTVAIEKAKKMLEESNK